MKHRAFTLIELTVVVLIIAIISTTLVISLSIGRGHAQFKASEYAIVNILQNARALSLANLLMEDETSKVDYYDLVLTESSLILKANGEGGEDEIQRVNLTDEFFLEFEDEESQMNIYYVPPYGDLCFFYEEDVCNFDTFQKSFTLKHENSDRSQTFTLSIYSGYPQQSQ